jgi:hypothetical protein
MRCAFLLLFFTLLMMTVTTNGLAKAFNPGTPEYERIVKEIREGHFSSGFGTSAEVLEEDL